MTRPSRSIRHFVRLLRVFLLFVLSTIGVCAATSRGSDPRQPPRVAPAIDDEDRKFWSFRPLTRTPAPLVVETSRARTPIDRFLLAALEQKGLLFSPDAKRTTLARRLCLDLTGIPPSPELIDAFENDRTPGAYERLVDRLLASPQFGERWGRHWLDVAGYVDTVGFDTDATNTISSEGKWRYRDYVIAAFKHDKPNDRFITEQIAGDELHDWRKSPHWTPATREALIATAGGGFKSGHVHGTTDDLGYRAVDGRVSCPELLATILNQLGLDHNRLKYAHHGREESLTDAPVTHARVVTDLLAKPASETIQAG